LDRPKSHSVTAAPIQSRAAPNRRQQDLRAWRLAAARFKAREIAAPYQPDSRAFDQLEEDVLDVVAEVLMEAWEMSPRTQTGRIRNASPESVAPRIYREVFGLVEKGQKNAAILTAAALFAIAAPD
jgi:hypothetical protein